MAQYAASFLKLNGVKRVFGLPGGENLHFLEALREAGLEFVLFHHETAAGFAAGAAGQLTGRPGVCLSTVGPGAVNLVAAAAAATLERSPMLAITAEMDHEMLPRVQHMKVDLVRLFDGAAKASFFLHPATAAADLAQAWRVAMQPPMGAVHVAIPADRTATAVDAVAQQLPERTFLQPDPSSLSQAQEFLATVDKIVVLAGMGVEVAQAQQELLALADAWHVPVAVTPKAKGHFPENHPLFAGCFSAYGDKPLQAALADAGAVLGVGLDSVDFITPTWDFDTPVINLSLSGQADPAINPLLTVGGDLNSSLKYLASSVHRNEGEDAQAVESAAKIRTAISQELTDESFRPKDGTVSTAEVIDGLRETLPGDGIVTVDVGVFKLVFLQRWTTNEPKTFFVANGLSAMGYAIPSALAIAKESPQAKVAAVVGDGALLMYAGELATVARHDGPLLILAVVDDALSLIRLKQLRLDLPVHGTEFQRIDYAGLAASFGLQHRLIEGRVAPEQVFEEALKLDRPVVVEARVDRDEYDHFR